MGLKTRPTREEILALDRAHAWHPYTPADAHEREPPLVVASSKGSTLFDADGRAYLDGNSSWWTMGLGHGHPRLLAALREQAETLAHCSFGGVTHAAGAELAAELTRVAPPGLSRVFYTDNGSTAIEASVRIALQGQAQRGFPKKTRFVALDGAFHGDTLAASSLGGIAVFRRALGGVLFDCVRAPVAEAGPDYAAAFQTIRALLTAHGDEVAAVFVEPIVQGAAGMRMHAPELLSELRAQCTHFGAWLVCDEVFAGYGRTGPMWASQHASVAPDLMCVGKTFSAPIPMGAVLATEEVYDAFRGARDQALMYGHTFCGNPLGARIAREVLAIFRDENILGGVSEKAPAIAEAMTRLGNIPGVARSRCLGMIGAADLASSPTYAGELGWRVYREALSRGAYVRPLGDTVYLCPPLTISAEELARLLGIFEVSIAAVIANAPLGRAPA